MADHEIDDHWIRLFRKRVEGSMAWRKLTNGAVRFEESCLDSFHHFVKGEKLQGVMNWIKGHLQVRWRHPPQIFPPHRPEVLAERVPSFLPLAQADRTRTCSLFKRGGSGCHVRDLLNLGLQPSSLRPEEVTHNTYSPSVFPNEVFFQAGLLHRFFDQRFEHSHPAWRPSCNTIVEVSCPPVITIVSLGSAAASGIPHTFASFWPEWGSIS